MAFVQWYILPVAEKPNTFTIIPAYDDDNNLVSSESSDNKEKYLGYGFAQGNECKSGDWKFTKSEDGKYSKFVSLYVFVGQPRSLIWLLG